MDLVSRHSVNVALTENPLLCFHLPGFVGRPSLEGSLIKHLIILMT